MSGTSGVGGINAADPAGPADPTDGTTTAELQEAFSQGVVEYMGTMVESEESDIQETCNDNTSDPDAPS